MVNWPRTLLLASISRIVASLLEHIRRRSRNRWADASQCTSPTMPGPLSRATRPPVCRFALAWEIGARLPSDKSSSDPSPSRNRLPAVARRGAEDPLEVRYLLGRCASLHFQRSAVRFCPMRSNKNLHVRSRSSLDWTSRFTPSRPSGPPRRRRVRTSYPLRAPYPRVRGPSTLHSRPQTFLRQVRCGPSGCRTARTLSPTLHEGLQRLSRRDSGLHPIAPRLHPR